MKITKTTMKEIDSLVSVEEVKTNSKKKSPYWVDNKKLNEHFIIYLKAIPIPTLSPEIT